jgi:hypothetical protein
VEPPAAEAPPPAPEPVAEATTTAELAPVEPVAAEAAVAEEDEGVPAGIRVDSDLLKLQFWAGATHDVGGVGIASDIYVDSTSFAEFDLGVELPIGEGVLLIPMAGIGLDWQQRKFTTLVAPQLFGYFTFDPIYVELWSQVFLKSFFADPGYKGSFDEDGNFINEGKYEDDPALGGNSWYNRLYLTYAITDNFRLGPQVEATYALNEAAKLPDEDGEKTIALTSLQVGGHIDVGYGEGNTLGLFLGYETVKEARLIYPEYEEDGTSPGDIDNGIVGRFTFVRYF